MNKDEIELIKRLRRETNLSMTECKKALEKNQWNYEVAMKYFREELSHVLAEKKSTRETNQGGIFAAKSDGVVYYVKILCETDFVSSNENFINLGKKILPLIIEGNKEAEIDGLVKQSAATMSENIHIKDIGIIKGKNLTHYLHGEDSGAFLSVVDFDQEVDADFAKKLCQHIVAFKPQDMDELKKQDWCFDSSKKVSFILSELKVEMIKFYLFSIDLF